MHFTISGSGSLRDFHEPESSDNRFDCNNWSVSDTVHLCFHNGKGTRHIECLRNHHFIHHPSGVYLILSKVPDSLPVPWGGVLAVLTVIVFGILAVYAISKLNFVEIEFFDKRK